MIVFDRICELEEKHQGTWYFRAVFTKFGEEVFSEFFKIRSECEPDLPSIVSIIEDYLERKNNTDQSVYSPEISFETPVQPDGVSFLGYYWDVILGVFRR